MNQSGRAPRYALRGRDWGSRGAAAAARRAEGGPCAAPMCGSGNGEREGAEQPPARGEPATLPCGRETGKSPSFCPRSREEEAWEGELSALDEATKEGKRPGRKGGEEEKEEGREKPGAAPPGEPRAAAGTFVSAPNSQPGKREEERGGKASANLGREKEAAAYLRLPELEPLPEPHPSQPVHGRAWAWREVGRKPHRSEFF
ncbi:uncharacterized protein [Excalfactoria chinensis]|uniref:uncharacterized protein n=1 Tax=Excalfactoria chinensis TaxID=46218 RepID=UPI003B3AE68E